MGNLPLLVDILARVDAVFSPVRSWGDHWPANACTARRQYKNHGIPWRAGGLSESSRKARQRSIEQLAGAGLIRLCKPSRRVKLLGVFLTDEGETKARHVCGLPGMAATWSAMQKLRDYSPDKWVYEGVMAERHPDRDGEKEWRAHVSAVESMFLPALIRGWVDGRGTVQAQVYYRMTQTGLEHLDAGEQPADIEPARHHRHLELYDRRLAAELDALRTRKPETGEIGECGLPVSMGHETTFWPAGYLDAQEAKK